MVKKTVNSNNKVSNEAQKVGKQKPSHGDVTRKKSVHSTHKSSGVHTESKQDNAVVFINDNTRINLEEKNNKSVKGTLQNDASKSKNKPVEKKTVPKQNRNNNSSNNRLRNDSKEGKLASNEIKVDTNFVTLTQDQLNLILNLVKTKQEIDVASVIDKEKKSDVKTPEKKKSSEGKRVEPSTVPGLDLEDNSQNENKNESDKENVSQENVSKLLDKVTDREKKSRDRSRIASPEEDNASGKYFVKCL